MRRIVVKSLALMLLVYAGAAQAQPAQSLVQFHQLEQLPQFNPTTLPTPTYTDLFTAGDTTGPITVRGIDRALSPELSNAVRRAFDLDSPTERAAGAIELERLAVDDADAAAIYGGAVNDGFIVGAGQLRVLADSSRQGNVLAQQSLDAYFSKDVQLGVSPDLAFEALAKAYEVGRAPGAESTLAQFYQYGLGVEANPEVAESYWKLATEGDNPDALLGFAGFLEQQGRVEESKEAITRASVQGYGPAIAAELQLAIDGQSLRGQAEVFAGAERSADKPEVALLLGDWARDRGAVAEAEGHYKVVAGELVLPKALQGQGLSRLAKLYVDNPSLNAAPGRIVELFDAAADLGDAGGLLGLAEIAWAEGRIKEAYHLSSRVAELGSEQEVGVANNIRRQACSAGTWLACVPVPVFFATTRRLIEGTPVSFDIRDEVNNGVNYGIAFVSVPVEDEQFDERAALFEAGKAAAVALFGAAKAAQADAGGDVIPLSGADPAKWAEEAKKAAVASGLQGAFVYVHGYNNPFDAAVRGSAETAERAGFPGLPIALSWASRAKTEGYVADYTTANDSCSRLVPPLNSIGAVFGGDNLTLMAHSLGAQVVYNMIGSCGGSGVHWDLPEQINNLIYAAPDMTRDAFTRDLSIQSARARHITVYVTKNDLALVASGAELIHDNERAGTGGDNARVLHADLETIDATDVEFFSTIWPSGDFFNHGYVFARPEVIADLNQLLRSKYAEERVSCLEKKPDRGMYFWMIKRDCQ